MKKVIGAVVTFVKGIFRKKVKPVTLFSSTFLSGIKIGDIRMERYRFNWLPSPSNFVEKHNLVLRISGGAEIVGPDLAASAITTTYDFVTDVQVEAWLRTLGDNGSVANSAHIVFAASNKEVVAPVDGFSYAFVEHIA